jgi:hypothetical protein
MRFLTYCIAGLFLAGAAFGVALPGGTDLQTLDDRDLEPVPDGGTHIA